MPYDPERHHRRSIRLRGYDYAQAGLYFVTICTRDRECLFGEVQDGEMHLNELGQIVGDAWAWLATQYPYVDLDAYIVMPNHLHGVIVLTDDLALESDRVLSDAGAAATGGSRTAPTSGAVVRRKPLGRLIGAFKTVSAKRIGELSDLSGSFVWQRDFYDHIIRNEASLERIRTYIAKNPSLWIEDTLHPDHPNPFPPPRPRTDAT